MRRFAMFILSLLTIKLRPQRVNELLGTDLTTEQVITYLQGCLTVKQSKSKGLLEVVVPTYRRICK